jgi:hypothetical protein
VQWSAELAEAETTVIEEERRMTRPDDTSTGTVLTQDQMARVATGRSYQDVITQVANVISTGEGGSNVEIKGANYTQTRYMIDGLDITDPITGTFSANINFDSISSIQVMTGAMDAEYNSLGGVINVVTDGGSDDWHAVARLFINNQHFSAGNQYGPQLYHGIHTFDPTPKPQNEAYQAVLGVGGPIVKHRLWFNLNVQYDYAKSGQPAGAPLFTQIAPALSHNIKARLKLTYAPSDKHRLELSISGDPGFFYNTNQSTAGLPTTENDQYQGGVFVTLNYHYFVKKNQQFDLSTGFNYEWLKFGAAGIVGGHVSHVPNTFSAEANTYNPNAAGHLNNDDGSSWYQGSGIQNDNRYTFQFDPSYSVRGKAAGSHDAKFGLQNRLTKWDNESYTPGGVSYSDFGGGAGEGGLCSVNAMGVPNAGGKGCYQRTISPASRVSAFGYALGAFVRDRWQPIKRLIIEPGIRADWGFSRNTIGQTVSNLFGVGPRLGLTVDLTGDQKTMFKAAYGRSNEVNSLLPAANATPKATAQVQQYSPSTGRFENYFTSGGTGGYRVDPYGNTPHTDEVDVSINREIFKDSLLEVDYTYKHFGNMWDSIETNQIWDPSGYRVTGYKNGVAEQVFQFSRPNSNQRTYQGIDFTFESRPNDHWDIYAAYTLGWLYGPGVESFGQISGDNFQSQYYNPRVRQMFDGFAPEDIRHNLKIRVSYNYKGFNVGTVLNWHTGLPATHLYFNGNDGYYSTRRTPTGTDPSSPNDVTKISEFRLPDVMSVDMRLGYSLKALLKQDLAVYADLFNAFNLGAVTSIHTSDNSTFGTAASRQAPFRFQLGFSYNY